MVDLICSEERCDIHDVEMVIDNEDGERPSGRNPWRGMCLRIDALDKIKRDADRVGMERSLTDHYSSRREFSDIPDDDIRMMVRDEMNKVMGSVGTTRKSRPKSGGTPL
jgi:hypothetical protein